MHCTLLLQNTPEEVYTLMLECWNEDHIKRPTFAVIEAKIEELLKSDRYVHNFAVTPESKVLLEEHLAVYYTTFYVDPASLMPKTRIVLHDWEQVMITLLL